ncbi:MAG TPA: DUF2272 domain-containing protein [Dongiaceae bacterium]|jgi:hypothetical protein|nr:DUF2272 domain-containing protein [Dongiaceae bacterium]
MPSTTARALATIAGEQYDQFHEYSENDPPLAAQIRKYWTGIGFSFPGVAEAWSAVFVSWCVKQSGASKTQFLFNPQHSQFVYAAIRNAASGAGVFRAYPIADYQPQIGDIVQNNRDGQTFDYDYASTHKSYSSHSAVVVESGIDSAGAYVRTIGGNESDSIRRKRVALNAHGRIAQRALSPYICVIQNLM